MALAERAGLGDLIAEHVRPGGECGVNAHLKVPCLVAGMAVGADSIDDMGLLWHGAMSTLFGGAGRRAADASVVAVAERLKATRVATLDHRHFRAVRPTHC